MSNENIKTKIVLEHRKFRAVARVLQPGDPDWDTPCQNCTEVPTVPPTALCGPCCFGEAETIGGNW